MGMETAQPGPRGHGRLSTWAWHVGVVVLVAMQKECLLFLTKGFFEAFATKWVGSVVGVYLIASLVAGIKRAFTKAENRRPFPEMLVWPAAIVTILVLIQTWDLLPK